MPGFVPRVGTVLLRHTSVGLVGPQRGQPVVSIHGEVQWQFFPPSDLQERESSFAHTAEVLEKTEFPLKQG